MRIKNHVSKLGPHYYVAACYSITPDPVSVRVLWQWWEGELERGYVVHRARYHLDQNAILKPYFQALAAFAATCPVPAHLRPRMSPPEVELVSSAEGHEVEEEGSGKRKEAEQGGEGPCEGEKDATLKYVMHDLAPELYIELMAGFH
jgi:hypothetical protein